MAIDFSALFQRAGKAAAENSPVILTALAATGTLATAYLAARGAFKSYVDVQVEETDRRAENPDNWKMSSRDMFDLTWKNYIPCAVSAALTVAAIVGVNRSGERSAAAMAMAYKASEKAYKEYREAAVEKVGKTKEAAIHEEAMRRRVEDNPIESTTIVYTHKGDLLVYDVWNDRYFNHDPELIRRAVNDFNQKVIHENWATLNDFWDLLGINKSGGSEKVGWDTDKLMELREVYQTVNGNPCMTLDFYSGPKTLN
jgi:hypothetical protein